MPITVYPARHNSEPCPLGSLIRNASPEQVLRSCTSLGTKSGQRNYSDHLDKAWSSSFGAEEHTDIYPSANGFVHGAIRAYNAHHHYRIRPDDVWIAILSQFSMYVNKNAEEMRSTFVSHGGKKALDLDGAILSSGTFDVFADKVTKVLGENVKDPSVTTWIMQRFSTTTDNDRIASGIIMMATFQAYFSYYDACACGIPSVTLLGSRKDWVQILNAIERLSSFGKEPTAWLSLLKPILSRFVRSFDEPTSIDIINFWQQIADYRVGGSGADYLSGWLTAFCFWNEKGNCTHPSILSGSGYGRLQLDGVTYGHIDWEDVPPGWATVPVELDLDENGGSIVRQCRMLAGSVGITPFLSTSDELGKSSTKSRANPPREDRSNVNKQQTPGRTSLLQKVLTCCQPRESEDTEKATSLKPMPQKEEEDETITLPPYSHSASDSPEAPNLSNHDQPLPDYENSNADRIAQAKAYQSKAAAGGSPPQYRLDGLQPRIGWWLWQEKVIDAADSEAYGGTAK